MEEKKIIDIHLSEDWIKQERALMVQLGEPGIGRSMDIHIYDDIEIIHMDSHHEEIIKEAVGSIDAQQVVFMGGGRAIGKRAAMAALLRERCTTALIETKKEEHELAPLFDAGTDPFDETTYMTLTNPYAKYINDARDLKIYEKQGSKFHK